MVHRSSTNQSDVIIRSDDRFLNLVVGSDSIVSKIFMLNFVLWLLFVFFGLHTDKNIAVLSQGDFLRRRKETLLINILKTYVK